MDERMIAINRWKRALLATTAVGLALMVFDAEWQHTLRERFIPNRWSWGTVRNNQEMRPKHATRSKRNANDKKRSSYCRKNGGSGRPD